MDSTHSWDGAFPGDGPHADPRFGSVPLAVISAIDLVLRDSATTSALLDAPGTVAVRYDTDGAAGLRRLVLDAGGVLDDTAVELECPCISCAMSADAAPALNALALRDGVEALLLVLPISADPCPVLHALVPALSGIAVASTVGLVDCGTAVDDIMGDATLAERGLCWTQADERSVGEALTAQLEFSDIVVTAGDLGTPGAELVEHLRADDQLLVRGHSELPIAMLRELRHRIDAAHARIDPRRVCAHGGPTDHGTWTLDLASERPFDPELLLENIEDLGAGRLRSRGHFWLPTRPDTVCEWDGAGGQVAIGACGAWEGRTPATRLIVTGTGDEDRERVEEAFAASLVPWAQWRRGLAPWLGCDDQMGPWLGERRLAS